MKYLTFIIILFCLFYSSANAQSKIEFGLTTEGSWFMPGEYYMDVLTKNVFGAGIGSYASIDIYSRLSADIGLIYRYKKMHERYNIYPRTNYYSGGGYSDPPTIYSPDTVRGWKSFPLYYVVLPVHFYYLIYKNIFVLGGVEMSWLTNYDTGTDKTEFNWITGFGCKKNTLKWSINYIFGFKDVAFANNLFTVNGKPSNTIYRNNMLQLSLSYPLWHKK